MNELTSIAPRQGVDAINLCQEILVNKPERPTLGHWRNKILSTVAAGVMIVGGIAVGEVAGEGKAQAETVTYDDLGYTWANAPCEFGAAGGPTCVNPKDSTDLYDWGGL